MRASTTPSGPRTPQSGSWFGHGGLAFEALNNAGVRQDIGLLVVITDSDMSVSAALGGGTDLHLRRKERRGGVLFRKASSALSRFE